MKTKSKYVTKEEMDAAHALLVRQLAPFKSHAMDRAKLRKLLGKELAHVNVGEELQKMRHEGL